MTATRCKGIYLKPWYLGHWHNSSWQLFDAIAQPKYIEVKPGAICRHIHIRTNNVEVPTHQLYLNGFPQVDLRFAYKKLTDIHINMQVCERIH